MRRRLVWSQLLSGLVGKACDSFECMCSTCEDRGDFRLDGSANLPAMLECTGPYRAWADVIPGSRLCESDCRCDCRRSMALAICLV